MTIGELVEAMARLKELEERNLGDSENPLDHVEFCEMLRIRDTVIKTEDPE